MTHHLVKPSRKGAEMEALETSNLTKWFTQARGPSALINATDVRIGIEKPTRLLASGNGKDAEIAFGMRGFARMAGEIPMIYVQRAFERRANRWAMI